MKEAIPSLHQLESLLGYQFRNPELLQRALTHASAEEDHNERLEFLGDSIFDFVISTYLFTTYPKEREGQLTEWKSLLVSRITLSRVGERLGLDRWIRSGGNLRDRKSLPRSLFGNTLEAILGAVYLDCEVAFILPTCQRLVLRWLRYEFEHLQEYYARWQAKQMLQNWAQSHFGTLPRYQLVDFHEHPETQAFQVAVTVAKRTFPPAWGCSKKEAEQRAAWEGILELRREGVFHAS